MKKLISSILFIIITASLSLMLLTSCQSPYKPVDSTDEERRVMMTLSVSGSEYTVKYELYRALFLALRESVDGGDLALWSGPDKDAYIEKIDALILERAAAVYSVFEECRAAGINLYSADVDNTVNQYITASVEGGYIGDYRIEGAGSYEKYLDDLRAAGLNYSVQDLIYRYTIGLILLDNHYKGDINKGTLGSIKYTREDVKEFYDGDGSVRIIRPFFKSTYFEKSRVEEIRSDAAAKRTESEFASFVTGYTTVGGSDIKNGLLIGRYSLDRLVYTELVDTAFELAVGEVSPVLTVSGTAEDGYCFFYRAEKSDKHFNACYDSIVDAYLENEIGRRLSDISSALTSSAVKSAELQNLDRSAITVD